jgi:hypothetical protein
VQQSADRVQLSPASRHAASQVRAPVPVSTQILEQQSSGASHAAPGSEHVGMPRARHRSMPLPAAWHDKPDAPIPAQHSRIALGSAATAQISPATAQLVPSEHRPRWDAGSTFAQRRPQQSAS